MMPLAGWLRACVGIAVFSLPWVLGCGRKPVEKGLEVTQHKVAETGPLEIARAFGLSLYPGSEAVDQSVKTERIRVPGEEPARFYETQVASIWVATRDPVEKIRAFYRSQNSHVITEERQDGELRFLQMASVPDLALAAQEGKSPVYLVNIKVQRLTEDEKSAYQNEFDRLNSVPQPDVVQRRRIKEVRRVLEDATFVQLNARVVKGD